MNAAHHRYPADVKRDARHRRNKRLVPVHTVQISDILRTEEKRIQVLVTATGEKVWVPRFIVEFRPGHIHVPDWLFRKLERYLVGPCA